MFEHNFYARIRTVLGKSFTPVRSLSTSAWQILRSCPPFYLALFIMAGYAVWESHTRVTMIAPFQLPKADLPFSGDIVADALQDSLKSIRNEIDEERQDPALRSSETGLPDLRNMVVPEFGRVQAPPRFAVEVKGLSYERILSVVRAVMRTEITISGDVIVKGKDFTLIARAADAGPWESVSSPITAEGLKQASRDLAEKIVAAQDPTLAGVALLKDGQIDQGLAALNRALSQHPTDSRLKLNLCMGFGANRRYDEAIECYKDVLNMNPSSPAEVSERLARVYYLKGERDLAIQRYRELRKKGYRDALLGLGEALDDSGQHEDALSVYDEFLATERLDRNRAIAHVKRSAALAHLDKHKEALEEYQQALKYAPRDLLILVHEGVELGEAVDLDAGIAQLQSVVDENKNADSVPFALLQLGLLLQKKGDWRGASDQFQGAAGRRPNYVEAHLKLAHALVHQGRQLEAFEEYNRVAKLSTSDLERGYSRIFANQWLGNELRDLGNYSGAASAYREAIRFKPDNSAAHCQLGLILARQGQLVQAIQEYGAALVPAKLKELNDSECLVMAEHQLGRVFASQRREHGAEGIAELRKAELAIKINAQSAAAHNTSGLHFDNGGPVEQAVIETRAQ
jgi:tetratricopeptide (TPR) repeat protein